MFNLPADLSTGVSTKVEARLPKYLYGGLALAKAGNNLLTK
jgi:hypothetical protein